MTEKFDLLLKNGTAFTPNGLERIDIGVRHGRVAGLGDLTNASAGESVDCSGLTILPGVIDTQVHFREPGLEHKEDLSTGTAAAVMGGVTAIFEMPNTKPATITDVALADKLLRAKEHAWCDHAFFIGATAENAVNLRDWETLPGCAGVKMFMGSSTGDLLVDEEAAILSVLENGSRRMAVHSEDESRLKERKEIAEKGADPRFHHEWRDVETAVRSTKRLLRLALKARRRIHVLHVTTAEEMEILANYREIATVEVTPQHLTLAAPDCYDQIGTLAQMNPPIREAHHRDALWNALRNGVVDCLGSDHAPHTLEEKAKPYPQSPSGMPGVQTLVPLMLDHIHQGRLTLERFVDLTSAGPARIYNIAGKGRIALGYDGDFTIVDLKAPRKITNMWIMSRCGWTPYDGMNVTGWPLMTIIRGQIVMREGELLGNPAGTPVRFQEALY
jgi:dihydroorotase